MKLIHSLLLWIALLFPITVIAFQNTPSPQMNAANQLFNNQKWEEAAKAYEVISPLSQTTRARGTSWAIRKGRP